MGGAGGGSCVRSQERGTRERAGEGELSRCLVERRALEQQTHREVPAQRHRQLARRHAVGPLFDLAHDAGPSSQGQQLAAQIVLALIVGDTELGERVLNRAQRVPPGVAIVGDEARERSRPWPHCAASDER